MYVLLLLYYSNLSLYGPVRVRNESIGTADKSWNHIA